MLHAMDTDAHMMVGLHCGPNGCDGHAWIEGTDGHGFYVIEATSGTVHRGARPVDYSAHYKLHPKSCFDVRDERTKRAAEVAAATIAAVANGGRSRRY
jgi:hypothetical protein